MQMSSENLCLATLSNTYVFLFFYVRFLSFFFYSKMVWGAVIVCIIYTTGYKTPLCHSPESTYRCGCTVYQHMYCNKISFACIGSQLIAWDVPWTWEKVPPLSSRNVKTKASRILFRYDGHFLLSNRSLFSRRLSSILIFVLLQLGQPGVSLCWPSPTLQCVLWLILLRPTGFCCFFLKSLWNDSNLIFFFSPSPTL